MSLVSDLSYTVNRKTSSQIATTCVMTLAPADFPLPFDFIAIRILKQSFPIGTPNPGFSSN